MNTKAIRIEHPESGEGLWRAKTKKGNYVIEEHSQHDRIQERHRDSSKFPTLHQDVKLQNQLEEKEIYDTSEYYFAFLSLDQLKEALTAEELKECINSLGFRVLLLELSDCIASPFQIIFKKEDVFNSEDISFMFL